MDNKLILSFLSYPESTKVNESPSNQSPINLVGKNIHFVGIGGCGMSGLARLVKHAGANITGSDISLTPTVEKLRDQDFHVTLEQTSESVPPNTDILVVTAAIKQDHPEITYANDHNITILKYAQMLGQLMATKNAVAVAGTHGKSTTTSLLAHILIQANLDPSVIVGANCDQIGGGSRTTTSSSPLLIAEACEYDRSFHHFKHTHAIILNVEEDHMEIYKSIDDIVEAFHIFAQEIPDKGSLLIQHELPHRIAITAGLTCKTQTIGYSPEADWQIKLDKNTSTIYNTASDTDVATYHNPMPGQHMAFNTAAAAVTANNLGAPWQAIIDAIQCFQGLDRRMQLIAKPTKNTTCKKVTVIDDYGHHPTEVDTTLRALRTHHKPNRLICVFQPHQHSRTRFLMQQFATSFSHADIVIVPDIYFVRDSEAVKQEVTASHLVDQLRKQGIQAMHLYPFGAIVEQLHMIAQDGDLIVTMGAGDVYKIAVNYTDKINS